MKLDEALIKEIERSVIYAARSVFGHKAIKTHIDARGRVYNGCDYLEEIKQDMLLKILEDRSGSFEKAIVSSKKDFMNLVMRSARNLSKNQIRDAREIPFSQSDTDFSGEHEDDEPLTD